MTSTITILPTLQLKPHEKVDRAHAAALAARIAHDGVLTHPIIIDSRTFVILDGHHRFHALTSLGVPFSPCIAIDYLHNAIRVVPWRTGETITKETVLRAGLSGALLEPKTSRHVFSDMHTDTHAVSLSHLRNSFIH